MDRGLLRGVLGGVALAAFSVLSAQAQGFNFLPPLSIHNLYVEGDGGAGVAGLVSEHIATTGSGATGELHGLHTGA